MNSSQMEDKLKTAFPDCDVAVIDLTGTEDHFEVRIASQNFAGLSRIKQHQSVMQVFASELKSGEVHALSIKTMTKD